MSLEWVAPTATAAVGLAGIAATWLTARASRIDQRNAALIQQKQITEEVLKDKRREAYATYLGNLYRVIDVTFWKHVADFDQNVTSAINEMHHSLAIVNLLGSDWVRQLSEQVASNVIGLVQEGSKEAGEAGEAHADSTEIVKTMLYMLERLMASDLGIPATAPSEEVIKHAETIRDASDTRIQFRVRPSTVTTSDRETTEESN